MGSIAHTWAAAAAAAAMDREYDGVCITEESYKIGRQVNPKRASWKEDGMGKVRANEQTY